MEDENKKVNEIKGQIKSLEEALTIIQSTCTHPETTIKFDSHGNSIKKICKKCEKILGYPTEEELKKNGFI